MAQDMVGCEVCGIHQCPHVIAELTRLRAMYQVMCEERDDSFRQRDEREISIQGDIAYLLAEQNALDAVVAAARIEHDAGEYMEADAGIHPAKWIDPNDPIHGYECRTPAMDAHNDAVKKFIEARSGMTTALAALGKLSKEGSK